MNIVVGAILQESNTFSSARSQVEDFRRYYFRVGEELFAEQKVENEFSGAKRAALEQGVTWHPTLYAQAVSSGPVRRAALDELKGLLQTQLNLIPKCDGVLFHLHGAWVAEDSDDADGEIVTLLRKHVGPDIPIVITLDSHANVTQTIINNVNGLVGYRTFPHIDYADTGFRAANLLFSIVRKEINPHISFTKVPMIVPAENQQTYRGPMFDLWEEAVAGERDGASMLTSLFAVQPWLDVAEMGFTAVTIGPNAERAVAEADRLGALAWSKRQEFDVELYSVHQVVAAVLEEKPDGFVIISDSADSPGAGSPGDSNFVLRKLLELGAEKQLSCLLSMVDAPAARRAAEAGPGSTIRLQVGHTISMEMGSPIEIEGTVAYVGDGKFLFGGGTVANLEANMGRCAVVSIGKLSLLLMENPTFTGDPAMYRSVGLEPLQSDIVLVKSANQFRAEYEPLASRIYILDTPGASTANLLSLPFVKIPRPMYPFDNNFF